MIEKNCFEGKGLISQQLYKYISRYISIPNRSRRQIWAVKSTIT